MEKYGYRFSFGPRNIYEDADPFSLPVRSAWDFDAELTVRKKLASDAVQLCDDDVVPGVKPGRPVAHANT